MTQLHQAAGIPARSPRWLGRAVRLWGARVWVPVFGFGLSVGLDAV